MWKAKVKDQLLACAITFMWTWSEHTGKTEIMVFVAKNGLRSDLRVYISFSRGSVPQYSRCMHQMCPCCAHVTCSPWLRHWSLLKGVANFLISVLNCQPWLKPKYGNRSEKKSRLSVFSALLTHECVCWGLVDKRGLNPCDVKAGYLALGLRQASLSQIVQCACDSQTQTKTNGECMGQPCGLYAPGMSWQWCRCECCLSSPMAQPATKLLQSH